MPELPEVETICRDLKPHVIGKTIRNVTLGLPRLVKAPRPAAFCRTLRQARITGLERKGKSLVFSLTLAGGRCVFLVIHLRMTGRLCWTRRRPDGEHAIFRLSGNEFLCYNDSRTLGEIRLVNDWRSLALLRSLGPEPLAPDFSPEHFQGSLRGKRGAIKALLLNQRFLAGIGNIYACEALFAAGIRPQRRAERLRVAEVGRLYTALRDVLQNAIRFRGTSTRDYRDGQGRKGGFSPHLAVYGRDEQDCGRCGGKIRRAVIAGRGTFYCPCCQK